MYKIYAETNGVKVCIHDDTVESDEVKVLEPRLHLADSNAGSLDFKLAPNNVAFQPIKYTQNLATALINGTAIDILSDMQSTGTGYDLITNQMHDIPEVPVTQQDTTVNQDADSLYFDYSITNSSGGPIDNTDLGNGSGIFGGNYFCYPSRAYTDPPSVNSIDVTNVSQLLFYGQYGESTVLMDRSATPPITNGLRSGGVDSTEDGAIIDSQYTLVSTNELPVPSYTPVNTEIDWPISIKAKLKDGINKQLEWTAVYKTSDGKWRPDKDREWTVFSDDQVTIQMVRPYTPAASSPLATLSIRLLCRYTDRTPISPDDIDYAEMIDRMELGYVAKIYYDDASATGASTTVTVKQGTRLDISSYANRKWAVIGICRSADQGGYLISFDKTKIHNAALEIGPSCAQHVYWFDESGTAIPEPIVSDPDWSVESDNLQNSFPIPNGTNNLIPCALDGVKALNTGGTWSENVYTYRGITYTFNGDGTIMANGTATGNQWFKLNGNVDISANEYSIHSGCSGYGTTLRVALASSTSISDIILAAADDGYATGTLETRSGLIYGVFIEANATFNNVTITPAFRCTKVAKKFKLGIHSTVPVSTSNLRFVNVYPQATATVKMEYSVNAIALMETKITVCRDLTTKTDGHRWNWKHYAESEMENGFVDYDGNEIEDDYTLISDMFELGSGARSIRVDVTAAENQNESFPDIKWGIVFYDNSSTPQFVRCDRWFDNHSGYDHLGVLDGLYNYRIMIRYVETEHPVSISFNQFSDIKSQQWWSVTNRKEKEIWEGRPTSEDIDFWNNRVIHCEGEMAYLNDTLQPSRAYDNYTIPQYVKALIDIHNSKSKSDRQFLVGDIWAPENSKLDRRITQYESTLELLNKLVEDYGGHLYVHKGTVGGKTGRVIDWLEDFPSKLCTQTINFGENLLDFTRNYDMSQMCTVVMPTGEVIQEAQSSKAGDPMPFIGGKPTYGQLLYKADDGRVYIRKGKNLGGYKTAVATVTPKETYYFSGRLHGGYVAYTIKSNSDGTGDYYDGGTVTAGSANEVGFVDYIDKEITIPAGAHSVVMCSFGNDIQMALKKQVKEVEGLDVLLTVEKIGDDIETVTENGQQIKKTWHVKGSPYVSNPDTIAKYGWIEKRLDLPDVTTEQDLYDAAKKYLKDGQFEEATLEVSAIDMNYFGVLVDDIMLLDQVRVISEPHNLDKYFPVTEIDIPLDNPADQTFTLGNKHEVSLTETSSSISEKLTQQVMKAPSMAQVVKEAKKNAADYISRGTTNGYINFVTNDDGHPCEFVISDRLDYTSAQANLWRWNYNGLMFSENGGRSYKTDGAGNITVGITNDGRIVANDVTAATLNGVTINGSTINGSNLTLGGTGEGDINNPKYILVKDTVTSNKSYVRIATDTQVQGSIRKTGIQFGTERPETSGGSAIGDYASLEENVVNLGGSEGSQPCLRILGNKGLALITPHLMTQTTWGQGVSYKTGVNQSVTIDGKTVEITNGLITGITQNSNSGNS